MKRNLLMYLVFVVAACGPEKSEAEAEEKPVLAIEKATMIRQNGFSPDYLKCDETDGPCRIKVICALEECDIFSGFGPVKLKINEHTYVGPEYGLTGPQKLTIHESALDITAAVDIQYVYNPNGRPNTGTICGASASPRC